MLEIMRASADRAIPLSGYMQKSATPEAITVPNSIVPVPNGTVTSEAISCAVVA
jgi:hypothetical protein